jgi:hypothetical protein
MRKGRIPATRGNGSKSFAPPFALVYWWNTKDQAGQFAHMIPIVSTRY